MIRVAAVGDVHFGQDSRGCMRPHLENIDECADVLLLAGDLTRHGHADEAAVLAEDLSGLPVPVITILGNHDYHSNEEKLIRDILEEEGIVVLDEETHRIRVGDDDLGIAGSKGFGGGFAGACATEFGEPEMKAFVGHTREIAARLGQNLGELQDCSYRIALLHYSPTESTLVGERLEIYPFLGSYLLAEAIDLSGADLVLHGHAHAGTEKGMTPGGVHVRNVAQPLIGKPFNIYCLGDDPA